MSQFQSEGATVVPFQSPSEGLAPRKRRFLATSDLAGSFDLGRLMAEAIPEQQWRIQGWIADLGLHILYSDEGLGKSMQACALMAQLASKGPNREWMGGTVNETCRVMYLAGEGAADMHKARIKAILKNNLKLTPSEATETASRIRLIPYTSMTAEQFGYDSKDLFVKDFRTNEVRPTDHLLDILESIKEHNAACDKAGARDERFGLLTIDTLAAMFGLDLMDDNAINRAMFWLVRECNAIGVSVLFIAHTNKSAKADDDDHRAALKGSQQVAATVAQTIYMRAATQDEAKRVIGSGLARDPSQVLAIRVGKSNLHNPAKGTRMLVRIADGAPVDVTGDVIEEDYTDIETALVDLVALMKKADPKIRITKNLLQTRAKDEDTIAKFPALKRLGNNVTKNGQERVNSAGWHMQRLVAKHVFVEERVGCVAVAPQAIDEIM